MWKVDKYLSIFGDHIFEESRIFSNRENAEKYINKSCDIRRDSSTRITEESYQYIGPYFSPKHQPKV